MGANKFSRRLFLGASIVGVSALFIIFDKNKKSAKPLIYKNNIQVLLQAAYHLFPHSKVGPGAVDLNISSYLSQVLKDKRIMESSRNYFLKGASWLEESAFESYDKSFLHLEKSQKEELFNKIVNDRWGANFVDLVLTYTFEALLSAPVYGSNIDKIGWKWLEHNPGFPIPVTKKEITYEV